LAEYRKVKDLSKHSIVVVLVMGPALKLIKSYGNLNLGLRKGD
jgi:hypothetical protein